MHLLAESGSTKTDWCEFDEKGVHRAFRTAGINPNNQSRAAIISQLREALKAVDYAGDPQHLFFYGAGLKGQDTREMIHQVLSDVFPGTRVAVAHDLLGAARSTCMDQPGITCILGNGSNSCYYNGQEILENMGGHGYLFGDEGGGSDLGKHLVRSALEDSLPEELISAFEAWAGMPILELRTAIYRSERPNVYMAQLSRFISENRDHPSLRQLVYDRFSAFFEVTVLRYPDYQQLPVHFVGSIAFHYREILEAVCKEKKIKTGRFIQHPIEGLVSYHQKVSLK